MLGYGLALPAQCALQQPCKARADSLTVSAADSMLVLMLVTQLQTGDTEVWGRCAATDLYRQYSSLCNYQTEKDCRSSSDCIFVAEYESEVCQSCADAFWIFNQ
jgi:hypothetical protein